MTATIVPSSEKAERALASVVNELEIRFTGGTPFFDALDERLRDPYWFRALLNKATEKYGYDFNIAVSGEFGRRFATWIKDADGGSAFRITIFPGDLRHTTLNSDYLDRYYSRFPDWLASLEGTRFVFLDDSYYKGRTYGQIKQAIEVAGGSASRAVVLYDGSLEVPKVTSLFRYHSPRSTRISV